MISEVEIAEEIQSHGCLVGQSLFDALKFIFLCSTNLLTHIHIYMHVNGTNQ